MPSLLPERAVCHGRLSENKRVTALALAIYDPDLPEPLAAQLQGVKSDDADEVASWGKSRA
jgi:hypothetical protein